MIDKIISTIGMLVSLSSLMMVSVVVILAVVGVLLWVVDSREFK